MRGNLIVLCALCIGIVSLLAIAVYSKTSYENMPPEIKDFYPKDNIIEVSLNRSIQFWIKAIDPEGEPIIIRWNVNSSDVALGSNYSFFAKTEGAHLVKVVVSDGINEIAHEWLVKVGGNHPPIIEPMEEIVVVEGDVVVLDIPARDPDNDVLYYKISEPIGDDKEWKTGLGDAGEYIINISVFDGEFEVNSSVKLIVKNIDQPPFFKERTRSFVLYENQTLNFSLNVYDPDGDEINISIKNKLKNLILDGLNILYSPDFDTVKEPKGLLYKITKFLGIDNIFFKGSVKKCIDVIAKANSKEANQTICFTVLDVNRPPHIEFIENITIDEGSKIVLRPIVSDPDGDAVDVKISAPIGSDGEWQTGYTDAGDYIVSVTASDTELSTRREFKIVVLNVNMPPQFIETDDIVVNEGELLFITPTVYDPDGDNITIKVDTLPKGSIFKDGTVIWRPDFDTVSSKTVSLRNKIAKKSAWLNKLLNPDEEVFTITFTASDGKLSSTYEQNIIVKNVDRKPVLLKKKPINPLIVEQGDVVSFILNATDPDNDILSYSWKFGKSKAFFGSNVAKMRFTKVGNTKVSVAVSDGIWKFSTAWHVKVVPKSALKRTTRHAMPSYQKKNKPIVYEVES